MTKLHKKVLGVLIPLLLLLSALLFLLPAATHAKALSVTRHATVLSANVYGDTLQVQCRISGKDSATASYAYTLYYSQNEADFAGDEIADTVAHVAVPQPAGEQTTAVVSVELGAVESGPWYISVKAVETTVETGAERVGYTIKRKLEPVDLTDTDQAYFMDCGSSSLYAFGETSDATLTGKQSRTWQKFGPDPVTGQKWGVVSEAVPAVDPVDKSLMASTLNASSDVLEFKFQVDDDATAYDVVMGFQDQQSTRINAAGEIFVNDDTQPAASYVGGYNAAMAAFTDVSGVEENGAHYITLQVKQSAVAIDAPMCNFISIRKKSAAEARYIGAGYIQLDVDNGAALSALPGKLTVYTTKGATQVDVTYESMSESSLKPDASFYQLDRAAKLNYGGKSYEIPVTVVVWTTERMHYFVDCAQALPLGSSAAKFEAAKTRYPDTLKNTGALDKPSAGSDDWGWMGVTPSVYWGNSDSYTSFIEGTDFRIVYNFPGLPKGSYTIEVGVTDPWGPRTSRIFVNDIQVGYMTTKTSQKAQQKVTFVQPEDNAPVCVRISGATDKPLVGWIAVAEDSVTVYPPPSAPDTGFDVNLLLIILLPCVIVLAAAGVCGGLWLKKRAKK